MSQHDIEALAREASKAAQFLDTIEDKYLRHSAAFIAGQLEEVLAALTMAAQKVVASRDAE